MSYQEQLCFYHTKGKCGGAVLSPKAPTPPPPTERGWRASNLFGGGSCVAAAATMSSSLAAFSALSSFSQPALCSQASPSPSPLLSSGREKEHLFHVINLCRWSSSVGAPRCSFFDPDKEALNVHFSNAIRRLIHNTLQATEKPRQRWSRFWSTEQLQSKATGFNCIVTGSS